MSCIYPCIYVANDELLQAAEYSGIVPIWWMVWVGRSGRLLAQHMDVLPIISGFWQSQ